MQGFLQIAVAQVHLEKGNKNGAMMLYGEGLGRLSRENIPDLGVDIDKLSLCVWHRLELLQCQQSIEITSVPILIDKELLL